MDEVVLDLKIIIDKLCRITIVGHNTSHFSCGDDHIVRLFSFHKLCHSVCNSQVKLSTRTIHQSRIS